MTKTDIDNFAHPLYATFKELYANSFPIFEQRTEQQQQVAFAQPQYHLTAFQDRETFIGFISYWEFEKYIYVEHFAINQALRGKGYGGEILKNFITDNPKIILLEIDPITDPVSAARLKFYQRYDFYTNPYPHTHPAYRQSYPDHSLIVLTTAREITTDEYLLFNQELTEIVMKF